MHAHVWAASRKLYTVLAPCILYRDMFPGPSKSTAKVLKSCSDLYRGRIEPLKAVRGHAMYVNIKIQTWPPVPKISYAVYGYKTIVHAQFTCASSH